jgi:hypothetical protein
MDGDEPAADGAYADESHGGPIAVPTTSTSAKSAPE